MHTIPEGFSSLQVSGDKAMLFLQGQVTCDVETISPGTAKLAAHCNPQGRVVSLFHLLFQHNAYELIMPQDMIQLTHQALKKYAIFFNVAMTPITPNNTLVDIATTNTVARKHIEEGMPVIHPATSGKLLPQELNLDALGAISYNKGCYTGQEIVARIHYRGKTKSSLYRADIVSAKQPQSGDTIQTGTTASARECGMIVESSPVSPEKYIALIVLDDTEITNKTLTLTGGSDTITIYPRK